MGPFPHSGPEPAISRDNPAGTGGFAFVEFAHPDPDALRLLFGRMGFMRAAVHRSERIELWRQGDITYVLNDAPGSHARQFGGLHGPSAPSMGWRVADAGKAHAHAVRMGARPYDGPGRLLNLPALQGVGGSLIYLADAKAGAAFFRDGFEWSGPEKPKGVGLTYIDHLTHNVHRGNTGVWADFYSRTFGFRQVRVFDIDGKYTGLFTRALVSPCGRIRIPVNEDKGETGQIVDYLNRYGGEGIQHIAAGTDDIYHAADAMAARGLKYMPKPPDSYYRQAARRIPGHGEPVERMARHGILMDGDGIAGGPETRVLLQIFSKTAVGPIFFEFIQRKGDEGFGEGNFKALFEAVERDQIERGLLVQPFGMRSA